jgi:hypothetical protein
LLECTEMNEQLPNQSDSLNNGTPEAGQNQVPAASEQTISDPESLAAVERLVAAADRALSTRATTVTIDPQTGARWRQVADPNPGGRVNLAQITSQDGSVEYIERTFGIHEGSPGLLTYIWRSGEPTVTLRTMHQAADGGIEERDTPLDPQSTNIESDLNDLTKSLARVYPIRRQ